MIMRTGNVKLMPFGCSKIFCVHLMKGLKLAYLPLTDRHIIPPAALQHHTCLGHTFRSSATQTELPTHHLSYTRSNMRDPFM